MRIWSPRKETEDLGPQMLIAAWTPWDSRADCLLLGEGGWRLLAVGLPAGFSTCYFYFIFKARQLIRRESPGIANEETGICGMASAHPAVLPRGPTGASLPVRQAVKDEDRVRRRSEPIPLQMGGPAHGKGRGPVAGL